MEEQLVELLHHQQAVVVVLPQPQHRWLWMSDPQQLFWSFPGRDPLRALRMRLGPSGPLVVPSRAVHFHPQM